MYNTPAQLKNCFTLNHRVTIYVPSTLNVNEAVDNEAYVNDALTLLSECFGGATSTAAIGAWLSPVAGLVKEKTTMVFAFATDSAMAENIDRVITYCGALCRSMSQECIALEVDGQMYFIDSNY